MLFLLFLLFVSLPTHAQQPAPVQQPAPAPVQDAAPTPPATTAFFLHDGDTVVFYGDSITEQGLYTRDIETWTTARHPDWHVRFINSGWNSDTVAGGKGGSVDVRLRRDVLPYHPTVVTVLLGMNDGAYHPYSAAAFDFFTRGMTHIVDTLTEALPGVRVVLLTPTFYDEAAPGSRHDRGYNAVMQKYGAFVKTLAAERGLTAVDLNGPLREATVQGRKHDPRFTLVPDGVHPDEAGQLVLAAAVLKAWNAPFEVPTVRVGPQASQSLTLPPAWPLPAAARRALPVSPAAAALSGLRFEFPPDDRDPTVKRWALTAGAGVRATLTAAQLTQNQTDLGDLPALPPNAQAQAVLGAVQDRADTWRYLWKGDPRAIARRGDAPTDAQTAALVALDLWLDARRDAARSLAQPQTHSWAIQALPPLPAPPVKAAPTALRRRLLRRATKR